MYVMAIAIAIALACVSDGMGSGDSMGPENFGRVPPYFVEILIFW